MIESSRRPTLPTLQLPKAWRTFKPSDVLRIGSAPFAALVSFLMAVFITVSAFDDVRLVVQTEGTEHVPWMLVACTVAYWTVWMALAFRPQLVAPLFLVQLATMLPTHEMGGPLLLALGAVAVAAYRASLRSIAVMVAGFLLWQLLWVPFVSELGTEQLWAYIPVTLFITAPGLAIKFLREKAIRVEQMQRAVGQEAAKAATAQRAELARELHDVVTHGLTMIAVQANLAKISREPEAQDQALTEIGAMARSSLDDLRRLLQTMRIEEQHPGGPGAQEAGPKPSVACIDLSHSLAETQKRLNKLGCATRVKTSGDLEDTPNGLRPTVVRILQEGATNVVKHSGDNTECEISLNVHEAHLELAIRSRMTPGKPRLPVSGTGLAGLRERASRLGGSLDAGPDGGWWLVRVVLPFKERQMLR